MVYYQDVILYAIIVWFMPPIAQVIQFPALSQPAFVWILACCFIILSGHNPHTYCMYVDKSSGPGISGSGMYLDIGEMVMSILCMHLAHHHIESLNCFIYSSNYTHRTMKLLGGILVSLRPSVRPSVPHPVSALAPTVLVGSMSYLYILSSIFRRCVMCKVVCKISKFEFLSIF